MQYKWKIATPYVPEFIQLHDKNWLVDEYVNKQKSARTIATENGCSDTEVRRLMRKFGIPRRVNAPHSNLLDKNWLFERYISEKLSARQIAALLGCNKTVVLKYLKQHDIDRRAAHWPHLANQK